MKKGLLLYILLLLARVITIQARERVQFSCYFDVMSYYNPAFAGSRGALNIVGNHGQHLTGDENPVKTYLVMADIPSSSGRNNHGIGILFYTESDRLFRNTNMAGQYAYRKGIGSGALSLGVQMGVFKQMFDGTKLDFPEGGG